MDGLTALTGLIAELIVLVGAITPMVVSLKKSSNGTKCLLRSEMLRIYYNNREKRVIRQYEYENFCLLREAYKAQHGNSFIDKIGAEVDEWEVIR